MARPGAADARQGASVRGWLVHIDAKATRMGKKANAAPSDEPSINGNTGTAGAGKRPRPQLTPEMLERMTPRPEEFDRMRRKLMLVVSGCGTLAVLAILAALYIPYWKMSGDAADAARAFMVAAVAGDVDGAMARSGIANRAYVQRQVDRIAALAGEGADVRVDGLEFVSDEIDGDSNRAYATGVVLPAGGEPVPFRLRVTWSRDVGEFRVYQAEIAGEDAATGTQTRPSA